MEGVLIPIIISVSLFAMISYIVAVIAGGRNRNRLAQIRSELQARMLEKFGTSTEFLEFAKTEEGRKLLESSTIERPLLINRTLSWVSRGIVVTMIGLGFTVLTIAGIADRDFGAVVSVLSLSVGTGFLLSAFVSRKLGRAWSAEMGDTIAPRVSADSY